MFKSLIVFSSIYIILWMYKMVIIIMYNIIIIYEE